MLKDPPPRALILLILLLAFGLRLYHLDFQSIWWDEGHSIEMASARLDQIATLPGMDVHPPGYFMALHLWMILSGLTEFALRYLSVVFSVLTVALLMRFGWAVGEGTRGRAISAVAAGLLAAILPLYVAYAQEVRMYAMVTFFALLSGYAQWRIVFGAGRAARQWWILYVLATAASLYIHYFTIFLLGFQNLAWLVWAVSNTTATCHSERSEESQSAYDETLRFAAQELRSPPMSCAPRSRRIGNPPPAAPPDCKSGGSGVSGKVPEQRLATWVGAQLAVVTLFAPQLPLALRQTTAYANPNLQPTSLAEFASRCWLAYTTGLTMYPQLSWLATVVAGLTIAVILLWAWHATHPGPSNWRLGTLIYLVGWFVVPLALYFLVLQRRPSFEPRYMIAVTPALLLLWSGVPLVRPPTPADYAIRNTCYTLIVPVILVVVLGLGSSSYFTNTAAFKDDSAGVVRWLATQATPDDLVYVDVPHPFHYYAARIPAPTRYLFVDVHTAARTLNAEAAGHRRVYWVTWHGSDTDPRGVIPFLFDKVATHAGDRDFRGYHVAWWNLAPDVTFSLPDDLPAADIVFGSLIRVDGAAFGPAVRAGDATWTTLHFVLLGAAGVDYRASLRLRNAEGAMLPPIDRDILNDRHVRTSAWPADDSRLNQAVNVYTLPIPAGTTPGDYRLEMVVYDAATLAALPVTGAPGVDGVSAWLGTVQVQE